MLTALLFGHAVAVISPSTKPLPVIRDANTIFVGQQGFVTNVKVGFLNGKKVTVLGLLPVGNGPMDEVNVLFCGDVSARFQAVDGWQQVILIYPRASADRRSACHELRIFHVK